MNTEKRVLKCEPKLPKSLAREYNLKTFMKTLDLTAGIICYDKAFQPTVNDGWADIRADLKDYKELSIEPKAGVTIGCGFHVKVPPGHELYFRPLHDRKYLLADASNPRYDQRQVRVHLINFGDSYVFIRQGDHLGDMCVRPTNNIPMILETEE